MNYTNKQLKKMYERYKKIAGEGDGHKLPYEKYLELLSRGGHLERSYKKRVGNITNKNLDQRYNVINKTLKKIYDNRNK